MFYFVHLIHSSSMEIIHDLLIIGGGINGAGIARDAVGRGLSVLLCEQGDIAGATSSASSKMIHGGLRYLEHYEFRLVSEALAEREVMLRIAPHLTRPLRFVMPHVPTLRPAWMVRLGLLLYDTLGRLRQRVTLPGSTSVDLRHSHYGAALRHSYDRGHVYSDVMDDDARLTLATVRSAAELGADILTRTRCVAAQREGKLWRVTLESRGQRRDVHARAVGNAAGPWVAEMLAACLPPSSSPSVGQRRPTVQLIKGSHIVVPRLYKGEHAYLLQNDDRRVIFLLPYEDDFTLIGTTEVKVSRTNDADESAPPVASAEEIAYLCLATSRFCLRQIGPADVVWHYSGLRPLFDDGHGNPADVTRDYTFLLDGDQDGESGCEAPLLSIFGGKLTTHRKLAEAALLKLAPWFPKMRPAWTDTRPLPGGDFENFAELHAGLCRQYPHLPPAWLKRLAHRHGSRSASVLGAAGTLAELGQDFGGGLYLREVEYFIAHEWATTADDILWRRSKAGLHMTADERAAFAQWFAANHPEFSGAP